MTTNAPLAIALYIASILEDLDIPYAIGGSVASGRYGFIRATNDVDLIADLREDQVAPFVAAVEVDFYADSDMIRDAVARKTSFNIIYLPTAFKVDIFVAKPRAFDQAQLARREKSPLLLDSTQTADIVTAEDIILAKLEWYKKGNCVSDRQWRDILGVLLVREDNLDYTYMRDMAVELNVSDLLKKALQEARA